MTSHFHDGIHDVISGKKSAAVSPRG